MVEVCLGNSVQVMHHPICKSIGYFFFYSFISFIFYYYLKNIFIDYAITVASFLNQTMPKLALKGE